MRRPSVPRSRLDHHDQTVSSVVLNRPGRLISSPTGEAAAAPEADSAFKTFVSPEPNTTSKAGTGTGTGSSLEHKAGKQVCVAGKGRAGAAEHATTAGQGTSMAETSDHGGADGGAVGGQSRRGTSPTATYLPPGDHSAQEQHRVRYPTSDPDQGYSPGRSRSGLWSSASGLTLPGGARSRGGLAALRAGKSRAGTAMSVTSGGLGGVSRGVTSAAASAASSVVGGKRGIHSPVGLHVGASHGSAHAWQGGDGAPRSRAYQCRQQASQRWDGAAAGQSAGSGSDSHSQQPMQGRRNRSASVGSQQSIRLGASNR